MRRRVWFALWAAILGWAGVHLSSLVEGWDVLFVLAGIPALVATVALLRSREYAWFVSRWKLAVTALSVVAVSLLGLALVPATFFALVQGSETFGLNERIPPRKLARISELELPDCAQRFVSQGYFWVDTTVYFRFECDTLDVDDWAKRTGLTLKPGDLHLDGPPNPGGFTQRWWALRALETPDDESYADQADREARLHSLVREGRLRSYEKGCEWSERDPSTNLGEFHTYVTVDRREPGRVAVYVQASR